MNAPYDPLRHLQTTGFAARVQPFCEAGLVSPRHAFLLDGLAPVFGETDVERLLWLTFVLEAQDRGHSALEVGKAKGILLQTAREPRREEDREKRTALLHDLVWPKRPGDDLAASWFFAGAVPAFSVYRAPSGDLTVQTQRMGQEEAWVCDALRALAAEADHDAFVRFDLPDDRAIALFGDAAHPCVPALRHLGRARLLLITGGPGTGKTWSIARILARVFEAWTGPTSPVVRLAAPTGKAAVRMEEALAQETEGLDANGDVKNALARLSGETLHRLLKIRPDRATTRYSPDNPLPADVLVVDEASMIDLPLMRKLVRAIGPTTRLVLLGDSDQLPSVDVGSVLGDLCAWGHHGGESAPWFARYTTIHRTDVPALKAVVEGIQDAAGLDPKRTDVAQTLQQVPIRSSAPDDPVARIQPTDASGRLSDAELTTLLTDWLDGSESFLALLTGWIKTSHTPSKEDLGALFEALDRLRVLAVHRRGPSGVSGLRTRVERLLRGRLDAAWRERHASRAYPTRAGHWLGEPILVTRNQSDIDLYNGDVGIVVRGTTGEGTNGELVAAFPGYGAHRGTIRRIPLSRLPEHESALVMTVHKSQGSQFGHAVVVLSPDASPIQTRELVYTGLSRARHKMTWVGTDQALTDALRREVQRGSLLRERLTDGLGAQDRVGSVEEPEVRALPTPRATATTRPRTDEQPATLSEFLFEALPWDGRPVGTRTLRARADQTPGLTWEEVSDQLTDAAARGLVIHEGRSYRLAPTAPAAPGSPLDLATRAVLGSGQPMSKREILDATGLDERAWLAIREALWRQPRVVYFGRTRGSRYASLEVFRSLWEALREELRTERGAEPQERTLRAAFEARHGVLQEGTS